MRHIVVLLFVNSTLQKYFYTIKIQFTLVFICTSSEQRIVVYFNYEANSLSDYWIWSEYLYSCTAV